MFGLNWITIAIIAGLGLLVGVQEMRVQSLKTNHAEYVSEVQQKARIASEQALQEQTRRQQAYEEEAEHARNEIKELEKTVVSLADSGDGLRGELASFKQRARAQPKPPNGSKGEPGPDALDLFAILYDRADREAAVLAEYSDRLRTAGIACEASADKAR